MNREALPLLAGICIPIITVSFIVCYVEGYDFFGILRKIDIIYYIVLIPFVLGAFAAGIYLRKNND
jgi:hypothetical protein